MGPESAKSFPGTQLVPAVIARAEGPPQQVAGRARQEADYGWRGKGYLFGALCPATGDVLTAPYTRRTAAHWGDFLVQVEEWIDPGGERIYAILDNLSTHRATDVLLFSLRYPRWELGFQPKYAPYLNLIEPWWKVLRALALQGQRFETWEQIVEAVTHATAYWNAHKHLFVWGRRRRHQPRRRPGIATVPGVQ
jgi:transposase